MTQIRRLLIANRSEIACRVIRTCRTLDIETVAVYSEADTHALHVRDADMAVRIGPSPAEQSYLDATAIINAAVTSGADAIHPGYGFLSENAAFATAVIDAGLIWVGPPPEAIQLMGDKAHAKQLMETAGVPVVAGFDASELDEAAIQREAATLGYPLLVKAAAGGGGKGMRPVHHATDLRAALDAARREANAAFGDDRLIIERLIEHPRHIEVQVFADTHGNIVHLFERDCSIQRRHQKIVEESPSPVVDAALRAQLGDAAIAATRAVNYAGAGTVEFIFDTNASTRDTGQPPFAFLEMNTRLQVEHPVTELVTGVDLVAWQIAVAEGEALPVAQRDLTQHGHAIEVRLYAEDPAREFLPQTGRIHRFAIPDGPGVRVDSGVEAGSDVTAFYDPMLAKLIVHADDRDTAVTVLQGVLRDTVIHGVVSNVTHLTDVLRHPAFRSGTFDTAFLTEAMPNWTHPTASAQLQAEVAVRLASATTAPTATDRLNIWEWFGPWRVSTVGGTPVLFTDGTHKTVAYLRQHGATLNVTIAGDTMTVARDVDSELTVDGTPSQVVVTPNDDELWALDDGVTHRFTRLTATRHADATALVTGGTLTSPMPGTVVDVRVAAGAQVASGDVLVVVEAMKMEHQVAAAASGIVTDVHVQVGDTVDANAALLTFTPQDDE